MVDQLLPHPKPTHFGILCEISSSMFNSCAIYWEGLIAPVCLYKTSSLSQPLRSSCSVLQWSLFSHIQPKYHTFLRLFFIPFSMHITTFVYVLPPGIPPCPRSLLQYFITYSSSFTLWSAYRVFLF